MNIERVIEQLKQFAPIFGGNVAGAAAYENGVADQVWLPSPAAYVVPLDMEAAPNTDMGGALNQVVTERVNVIVQFDNSIAKGAGDRRGQAITSYFDAVFVGTCRAILNWRPDAPVENPGADVGRLPLARHAARGLYLAGGGLITFDRARLFYRWAFALEIRLSHADGWMPPSEPLRAIEGRVVQAGSKAPGVTFRENFPRA